MDGTMIEISSWNDLEMILLGKQEMICNVRLMKANHWIWKVSKLTTIIQFVTSTNVYKV